MAGNRFFGGKNGYDYAANGRFSLGKTGEVSEILGTVTVESLALAEPAEALTAEDAGTVDGTWDADAAAVVNNTRTRVGEIEAALIAAGILEEPA